MLEAIRVVLQDVLSTEKWLHHIGRHHFLPEKFGRRGNISYFCGEKQIDKQYGIRDAHKFQTLDPSAAKG